MKLTLTVARCGTCGKSRGLRHVCVTRATSKRRKTRTRIKPRLDIRCGSCGKPMRNPLTHTCTVKTDFAKRRHGQLRQQKREREKARRAEQRKRRREREKARRAKAAAARKAKAAERRAAAKTRTPRPRPPVHEYTTCRDPECTRYGCLAYRQGIADCPLSHGA